MKKFVMTVLFFVALATPSMALLEGATIAGGVPVRRNDIFMEKLMQSLFENQFNWLKTELTSIADIQSLGDLLALPKRLESITKKFNLDSLGQNLLGSVMNEISSELTSVIGDSIGETFSGDELTKGLGAAIISAIQGRDFESAAQNIFATLQGIAMGKISEDITKAIDDTETDPNKIGDEPGEDVETGDDGEDGSGLYTDDEVAAFEKDIQAGAQEIIQDVATSFPYTLPQAQVAVAMTAIQGSRNPVDRELFLSRAVEESRVPIIGRIGSVISTYRKDGPHQKMLEKFEESNKELADNAKSEFAGETESEGQALRYLVGMTAVQIQQTALTNSILLYLSTQIADEINLLGTLGYMNVETYTANVKQGIREYGVAFEQSTSAITR